jgi:hypothetical protein
MKKRPTTLILTEEHARYIQRAFEPGSNGTEYKGKDDPPISNILSFVIPIGQLSLGSKTFGDMNYVLNSAFSSNTDSIPTSGSHFWDILVSFCIMTCNPLIGANRLKGDSNEPGQESESAQVLIIINTC